MRKPDFKFILSVIAFGSMMSFTTAQAAPVQMNQVVQVVNAKPGKAATGSFAELRLNGDDPIINSDDETKKAAPQPQQDDRVITETRSEIVEDEACDCLAPPPIAGFPYGWLALGAAPLAFLIPPGGDDPPNSPPPTEPTPTPPPPTTPTPTPTPEPMTILLFGTGLAGVGFAARRKLGKKDKETKD